GRASHLERVDRAWPVGPADVGTGIGPNGAVLSTANAQCGLITDRLRSPVDHSCLWIPYCWVPDHHGQAGRPNRSTTTAADRCRRLRSVVRRCSLLGQCSDAHRVAGPIGCRRSHVDALTVLFAADDVPRRSPAATGDCHHIHLLLRGRSGRSAVGWGTAGVFLVGCYLPYQCPAYGAALAARRPTVTRAHRR